MLASSLSLVRNRISLRFTRNLPAGACSSIHTSYMGRSAPSPVWKERLGKLLVANRGEIACRVLATAKRLGIPTVVSSWGSADVPFPPLKTL